MKHVLIDFSKSRHDEESAWEVYDSEEEVLDALEDEDPSQLLVISGTDIKIRELIRGFQLISGGKK